jgi:hypothetical protein
MAARRHYLCEFRFEARRLYVIWRTNDKDGLVRSKDGKIAAFADERRAADYCRTNDISLMPESPAVYDFDMIAAWCEHPRAESIDCVAFLNAWNMLEDVHGFGSEALSLHKITSRRADEIYNKLFFGNNPPAVTPDGARYEPIWSEDEIDALSRMYRFGLAELRASISAIDPSFGYAAR